MGPALRSLDRPRLGAGNLAQVDVLVARLVDPGKDDPGTVRRNGEALGGVEAGSILRNDGEAR